MNFLPGNFETIGAIAEFVADKGAGCSDSILIFLPASGTGSRPGSSRRL